MRVKADRARDRKDKRRRFVSFISNLLCITVRSNRQIIQPGWCAQIMPASLLAMGVDKARANNLTDPTVLRLYHHRLEAFGVPTESPSPPPFRCHCYPQSRGSACRTPSFSRLFQERLAAGTGVRVGPSRHQRLRCTVSCRGCPWLLTTRCV